MKALLTAVIMVGFAVVQATGPYSVKGNQVLDSKGQPYLFRGLDRCSLEWEPEGDHISLADFQLQRSWKSNTVRVPLNQDFWLQGAKVYSAGYKQTIINVVKMAQQAGIENVILDLHWSDKGDLSNAKPGQQRMADANSIQFWKNVSATFKDNANVLFELYNEPHDVSWSVWLNGGDSGDGFNSVGMQQLYDAVRSTGASNVVIVGGLNWAYDLSEVPSYRVKGTNIMYNTHPYNFGGKQPAQWDASFGNLASTDPVIATEFGDSDCSTQYYEEFVNYAETKKIHWTAWAWYPGGCTFPAVINDWNGTPSASGQIIKAALAKNN